MAKFSNVPLFLLILFGYKQAKSVPILDEFDNEIFDYSDNYSDYLSNFDENYNSFFLNSTTKNHPHSALSTIEIIELYDYESEEHQVQTKDGYKLTLHRINGKKGHPLSHDKPPIFLMHGILLSSRDWTIGGPNRSLAFILSDAGYDVWMGNTRGNIYSRGHVKYSTYSSRYWDFSLQELGVHDVCAFIDYVLDVTKHKKLHYIGYSQGTTIFYVMASERPEYNEKIELMISLAPVSYSGNMYSPILRYLAKHVKDLHHLATLIGIREFKPSSKLLRLVISWLCPHQPLQEICVNVIFMLSGYDPKEMDRELLPAILTHVPSGSGMKVIVHFAQIINSGKFQLYDYQSVRNQHHYGTRVPPRYNLSRVTAPVALLHGSNDWISHPKDVEQLYEELGNPVSKHLVRLKEFNHLDFIYALDVRQLVYVNVLELLSRYTEVKI